MGAVQVIFRPALILFLASLLVATALPVAAQEAGVPIPGKLLRIKTWKSPDKRGAMFFGKGDFRDIIESHDPRVSASYLVFVSDGPWGDTTARIDLDPGLWQVIGRETNPRGYRYKDPSASRGGIRKVILEPNRLVVLAKGASWEFQPSGGQGSVWVHFGIEGESVCAEFGGKVKPLFHVYGSGFCPNASENLEDRVRALIDGETADCEQVLMDVAYSDGWPVETATGSFLFLHCDAASGWSLAGDHNGWAKDAMTAGAGFSWIEAVAAIAEGQKYKFVSASGQYIADPTARSYGYDEYGQFSLIRPPTDAYRFDRWPRFEALGLLPRELRVFVPPGVGPWPTLYLHDGQNLFDPDGMWGGWKLQDAVAAAGNDLLLVGIDNTADRMSEYVHADDDIGSAVTSSGDAYADLVETEIRPLVESRYATGAPVGMMGSSLGGLISLYIAHRYPDRYDFAGSLSGTLGWGRFGASNPTIEELYLTAGLRDTVIYADSGGSDGGDGCTDPDGDGSPEDDPNDSDNYCTNRQFVDALAGLGYTWDVTLHHWHAPGAEHNEAAWAARVNRPLGIFLDLGN